jgi:hypothetical protein
MLSSSALGHIFETDLADLLKRKMADQADAAVSQPLRGVRFWLF